MPLLLPGLRAASGLVFLSSITELTATLLLAPIGTRTLATKVWANGASLAYSAAAPYALVMVVVAALPNVSSGASRGFRCIAVSGMVSDIAGIPDPPIVCRGGPEFAHSLICVCKNGSACSESSSR